MRRLLFIPVLIVLFGICVSCIPKEEGTPHWMVVTRLDVDGDIIRDTLWSKEFQSLFVDDPIDFETDINTVFFHAEDLIKHRSKGYIGFQFWSDTSFFYYYENALPKKAYFYHTHKTHYYQSFRYNGASYLTGPPEVSTLYLSFLPSDTPDVSFSFEFEFTNMISDQKDTIRSLKGRVDVAEYDPSWGLLTGTGYAFNKDTGIPRFLRYRE